MNMALNSVRNEAELLMSDNYVPHQKLSRNA